MSRPAVPPPTCDGPGCGKTKQAANHWWTVGVSGSMVNRLILIAPFSETSTYPEWRKQITWYDCCGQDCALKVISEQMGKA